MDSNLFQRLAKAAACLRVISINRTQYMCRAVLVLLACAAVGCANYIGGDFEDVVTTSIPISMRFSPIEERGLPDGIGTALEALLSQRPSSCDVSAPLRISYELPNPSGNLALYASGLTLGILPTYWTTSGTVTASILDQQGVTVRQFAYKVRFHTWYGWLALLVQPSKSLNAIPDCDEGSPQRCFYNAVARRLPDRLITDMQKDPLFYRCPNAKDRVP